MITDKWIDLVYKVATGDRKRRMLLAPVAGFLVLSFIALCVFLCLTLDRVLQLPILAIRPWSAYVGACITALGFFLMILSIFHFAKVKGTPVPLSPPPKLVTSGPYGMVRNPMLTGVFIQIYGLGLAFGSVSLIYFFLPLLIAANVWELKKVEEPELERRLGDEYREYKKRVPMFFPRLRPKL